MPLQAKGIMFSPCSIVRPVVCPVPTPAVCTYASLTEAVTAAVFKQPWLQ